MHIRATLAFRTKAPLPLLVSLQFCPENDLMYPKMDMKRQRLIFFCKHCGYDVDAAEEEYCIQKWETLHERPAHAREGG